MGITQASQFNPQVIYTDIIDPEKFYEAGQLLLDAYDELCAKGVVKEKQGD